MLSGRCTVVGGLDGRDGMLWRLVHRIGLLGECYRFQPCEPIIGCQARDWADSGEAAWPWAARAATAGHARHALP